MTNLLTRSGVVEQDLVTSRAPRGDAAIKPRGALVIIVGPDGVGKTTVARALGAAHRGPSGYFHFVPPIGARLSADPPAAAPHLGKGHPGGSRLLGCARLIRNIARFWLAYVIRVRPAMAQGMLVIGDRGMFGYLVQPHALKFHGPASFARRMLRLLPAPTLVVNLAAPPHVVRARKQELTLEQIARELRDWREIPATRLITLDATATPNEIARRVLLEL